MAKYPIIKCQLKITSRKESIVIKKTRLFISGALILSILLSACGQVTNTSQAVKDEAENKIEENIIDVNTPKYIVSDDKNDTLTIIDTPLETMSGAQSELRDDSQEELDIEDLEELEETDGEPEEVKEAPQIPDILLHSLPSWDGQDYLDELKDELTVKGMIGTNNGKTSHDSGTDMEDFDFSEDEKITGLKRRDLTEDEHIILEEMMLRMYYALSHDERPVNNYAIPAKRETTDSKALEEALSLKNLGKEIKEDLKSINENLDESDPELVSEEELIGFKNLEEEINDAEPLIEEPEEEIIAPMIDESNNAALMLNIFQMISEIEKTPTTVFETAPSNTFTRLTIPEGFTLEDLRILTCLVYHENGLIQGEVEVIFYDDVAHPVYLPSHVMHQWTAQVCLNHLTDPRFANNIWDDVALPRYTALYREESVAYDAIMAHPEVWMDCMYDCLLALNGYIEMPEHTIYESNFPQLGTHFASVHVDLKHFESWSYFSIG